MTCRKCGASNPVVFLAPVVTFGAETCICYACARARHWLDPDGNLKPGIEL
jgi:predicted hotdog family 3-hydroxylacyl-ACP dehydratase